MLVAFDHIVKLTTFCRCLILGSNKKQAVLTRFNRSCFAENILHFIEVLLAQCWGNTFKLKNKFAMMHEANAKFFRQPVKVYANFLQFFSSSVQYLWCISCDMSSSDDDDLNLAQSLPFFFLSFIVFSHFQYSWRDEGHNKKKNFNYKKYSAR